MQYTVKNLKDGTTRTVELKHPFFVLGHTNHICYLKNKTVVVDVSRNSITMCDSGFYPGPQHMFNLGAKVSDREEFADSLKKVTDNLDAICDYLGNLTLSEEDSKEYAKEQAEDIRQQNHENI